MAQTTFTSYVATKAAEFEIELMITGDVDSRDEGNPEVTGVDIAQGDGTPLPRRVLAAIKAKDWDDITARLIEADTGWS